MSSGAIAGCDDLKEVTDNLGWKELLAAWYMGFGGSHSFGISSLITRQLATGPFNGKLLQEVSRSVAETGYSVSPEKVGGSRPYVDGEGGWIQKLPNFTRDVMGMATDGAAGQGTPDAFLGSFNEVYQVLNVNKEKREFTVAFAAFNRTGTASLTHIAPDLPQGLPMASLDQTYYWVTTVTQ
ncbi:hypothetical protein [Streptomyces sp. NPDC093707]|uniref:hypothetical protein n=1 Tax=Streptomyces sp. NPDC093707 TaxID=3154984 RepID=UPI00344BAF45